MITERDKNIIIQYAEKYNVEIALGNLKDAMARMEKTVIELAAIATFLKA